MIQVVQGASMGQRRRGPMSEVVHGTRTTRNYLNNLNSKRTIAYCAILVAILTISTHFWPLASGVNCDQIGEVRKGNNDSSFVHIKSTHGNQKEFPAARADISKHQRLEAASRGGSGGGADLALAVTAEVGGGERTNGGHHQANKPTSNPHLRRIRRFANYAGRGKTGRVMLAQRPKTTTTTTTTSTSTTEASKTTAAAGEIKSIEMEPEESNDSGDYEDLVPAARKPKVVATSTEMSRGAEESGNSDEEVGGEEEEEEEVEQAEEQTTTTTTTQRSTTRRMGGSRKGTASRRPPSGKVAPIKETGSGQSSATTKFKQKGQSVEEEEKEAEVTEVERKKLADDWRMLKEGEKNESLVGAGSKHLMHGKRKPLVALPFIRPKNTSVCIPEAYLEFPRDLIGEKWRARGLILVHVLVVCYMFYALAVVCERYFMPSLEEFAQRLNISEDVAGATLMSAGSSAPELFTAILGVFVAKGDVGTGAIVGSAVFNILFVIGVCAFVSTTTAQLQWWPVLRDSVYYTLTVLVLIMIIYDERITAFESASMICLYGVYIGIMMHNEQLKEATARLLLAHPFTAKLIGSQANITSLEGPDDVFGNQPLTTSSGRLIGKNKSAAATASNGQTGGGVGNIMRDKRVEDDSIYMAALLLVVRHKRLFKSPLRFQSAARYVIVKRQHRRQVARELEEANKARKKLEEARNEEVNYFGPENELLNGGSSGGGGGGGVGGSSSNDGGGGSAASRRAKMEAYARSSTMSKNKFSIVSKDDYEFWHRPPEEGENYYLWLAKIPVNYVLHYTCPDCTLYPDKYALTFVISICWTAFFSYIMVWMVTIIGYTLGIPDSVMGVTFLAAGTSVPDCYSSIHAARNGMADMAVSNSIGSNVFDILIGLAVPWFIQSAIYPGVVATVNSRGVIYSVILLFLSLVVTIYLMNRYDWNLQPRLGLALIIAYALFIILTCMLEFNLFGHVNPPPCPPVTGSNY